MNIYFIGKVVMKKNGKPKWVSSDHPTPLTIKQCPGRWGEGFFYMDMDGNCKWVGPFATEELAMDEAIKVIAARRAATAAMEWRKNPELLRAK